MLADTLKEIAGKRILDAYGAPAALELRPPATDAEIKALEASLPAPLPEEIRAALGVTTGLANGPLQSFGLLDLVGFGLEDVFPRAYSIAEDGDGNSWILDLLPDTTDWGPVFFACHDPAVIAYQSASLEVFLRDVVAKAPDDQDSPITLVRDEVVNDLWSDTSSLIEQPVAASSPDAMLCEFASTLAPDALIADLRELRFGSGFAWGKFGAETKIQRCGTQRLWGLTPPPTKPGLLRRLFKK